MKISANIGFLWADLPHPERVRRAAAAGFDAVECHFPYDTPVAEMQAALAETGLPMLGLNTRPGDPAAGDFGLCALPDRIAEARAAIDQAVAYGAAIGARNVHVMAGRGGDREVFMTNLAYAASAAGPEGMTVLIEPINRRDVERYHISHVEEAAEIIRNIGAPNIRIMFDCYHTQIMQGDLLRRAEAHMDMIGHIQIAAVPSRAEPDEGEIAYDRLIPAFYEAGYEGWIGAEYRPRGRVEDGLGWLRALREG